MTNGRRLIAHTTAAEFDPQPDRPLTGPLLEDAMSQMQINKNRGAGESKLISSNIRHYRHARKTAGHVTELKRHALLQIRLALTRSVAANLSVSAASAASSAGLFGLLLLEDPSPKSSGHVATADRVGNVIFAVDNLNRNPEGTTVILAARASRPVRVAHAAFFWCSCAHDITRSHTAQIHAVKIRSLGEVVVRATALASARNSLAC